jgi:hypothetical protein
MYDEERNIGVQPIGRISTGNVYVGLIVLDPCKKPASYGGLLPSTIAPAY